MNPCSHMQAMARVVSRAGARLSSSQVRGGQAILVRGHGATYTKAIGSSGHSHPLVLAVAL